MWDLPRSGLEPVSPALAGRFSTTVPPGKPNILHFISPFISWWILGCFLFLSIMLQWTLLCKHLFESLLSISLGIYCLRSCQTVFQSDCISNSSLWEFQLLYILTNTIVIFRYYVPPILVYMKWYLMILVCISLLTNYVYCIFTCLLAICISSWRNVYSDPSATF